MHPPPKTSKPTSISNPFHRPKLPQPDSSPAEVAAQLAHLPNLVFLDSSGHHSSNQAPPISVVGANPTQLLSGNLNHLPDRQKLENALRPHQLNTLSDASLPSGAAIGHLDYHGHFTFGLYPELLLYTHQDQTWHEIGQLSQHLNPTLNLPKTSLSPHWKAHSTQELFTQQVKKIQAYITAGDIYQVNLSQKFSQQLPKPTTLFPLYQSLREACPAPMAAYLNLLAPDENGQLSGTELLSASPETFLKINQRQIETRPIKGTRPRHLDNPTADQAAINDLTTDPKERAELIMITDLLRNDLGKVCDFGTVHTPHLLQHEQLAHVHHLVSTVRGTLRSELSHLDALHATLPGGSITGAPKKRACEIIAELETVPRGPYTGVIGYLGFNGQSQFNIAIRTLVHQVNHDTPHSELSYHVGAGIVADSDPTAEFQETLQKAKGLRQAIAQHTAY